jgi:hypothetical protein
MNFFGIGLLRPGNTENSLSKADTGQRHKQVTKKDYYDYDRLLQNNVEQNFKCQMQTNRAQK